METAARLRANPRETHVFFVDDEPGIRMAVQRALETSGMHVSTFARAQECLAGLSAQACDVLITDLRMDGMDGMTLLHEVRSRYPWIPTVMTTGYGDMHLAVEATKAGAADFLEKPLDRQDLLSAVQRAMENTSPPEPSLHGGLSRTEVQVLRHIFDGETTREIAHTLSRSTRTIDAHRSSIMRKFGARNAAHLIQRAIALGFDNGWEDCHTSRKG